MVQDGSDMAPKRPSVTNAHYLQTFRGGSGNGSGWFQRGSKAPGVTNAHYLSTFWDGSGNGSGWCVHGSKKPDVTNA